MQRGTSVQLWLRHGRNKYRIPEHMLAPRRTTAAGRGAPTRRGPEEAAEPGGGAPRTARAATEVMAPTRMNLRVRRRDNAAAAVGGGRAREEEAEPGRRRESSRKKSKAPPPPAAVAVPAPAAPPPAEEASPDSKCPICLDRFDNVAFLDRCLHRFCFPCIQEWSHSKAECPLCKQPFASILHSVRAEDDFKEYTLRPPPASGGVAATVAMVAAMATVARSSHQMRLTLRRHRAADGGETAAPAARRRGRERGGARRAEDGEAGVWEWYLDSPPPSRRHAAAVLDEQAARPEMSSEERGVIFEGLAGLEGAETPVAPDDRASRRLMTRLAARRRQQREGGAPPRRLREREALALRRALYRCGVRVRGVAGATGDSGQPQRDVSANGFRRSPALLHRLRPWLRRELTVLYGAHGSLVEIVQRIIAVRLARHGLEDPPALEEELRPFLLARTEHFLHELASFARSPLGMDGYDLQAVYEPPAAAAGELDWIGSSSDGSSVIAISEEDDDDEAAAAAGGAEGAGLAEVGGANEDGCLSMSGWDDETPGPSYSSAAADQSCSLTSPAGSPAPPEEAGEKGEEEECLIVGYKKPIAERTPELVQLSSDSEEERQGAEPPRPPEAPPLLPEAPPLSLLPTIPASTSAAFGEEAGPRRARSWSESSRNSACTVSPAASPGGGNKRRRETAAWREKRRKRRRKRRRGTISNPNRSIYPAMLRRHRCSSGESGSPTSPAPSSSWEISSLSSSSSSSSSSPLSFSPPPPQTPPTPAAAAAACDDGGGHGEKPGGKRKYKSRHLDNEVKDPTWRPRRRGRDGGSRTTTRERRSPSVEIVYEGTVAPGDTNPPGNKRRRRRRHHHRRQRGSSPVVITLDSDSGDGASLRLSALPPLPLVPPAGVGGALEAPFGELPVDILDRGSDGSAGRRGEDSERDVDVEEVGGGATALGEHGPIRAAGPGPGEDGTLPPLTFNLHPSPESRARRDRKSCHGGTPLDDRGRGRVGFRPYDRNTPPPLKHKDAGSPPFPPGGPAPLPPDLHLVKRPDDVLASPPHRAPELEAPPGPRNQTSSPSAGAPLDHPDGPPSLRTSLVDPPVSPRPPHTDLDLPLRGPPDPEPAPPQDFHWRGRSLDGQSDAPAAT